ncbi:membrane protein [Leifsonia kafniensis]|uniref:Membrane protein n=1 Tax=Leifsonia kafniensis TaxID=475957 RepID=A0ABP7K177_9MICO
MSRPPAKTIARPSIPRTIGRMILGVFLIFAGVSHLTFARQEFVAQVPDWVPASDDVVVIGSGVVEISLGAALLLLRRRRVGVGCLVAAFFVAIFPGNLSQYVTHTDAFGLDSDRARGIRLLLQPLLVVWALWSTGAWKAWRAARAQK